MLTHLPSSRLVVGSLALGAFVALAGCDDTESDPGAGGSASSGTAISGATTVATSAGSGGTGGSGGDEAATTSSGGPQPTCENASVGSPCDVDGASCEVGQGRCAGVPNVKRCVGERWELWSAITCDALEADPSCPVVGRYLVEPSGPFEPSAPIVEEYGAPFEVAFEVRDDGRLYITADDGSFDPGTCDVQAHWTLADSCYEEGGGTFCETSERRLELTASSDPAVGTVRVTCEGECDEDTTAPVTGTRL